MFCLCCFFLFYIIYFLLNINIMFNFLYTHNPFVWQFSFIFAASFWREKRVCGFFIIFLSFSGDTRRKILQKKNKEGILCLWEKVSLPQFDIICHPYVFLLAKYFQSIHYVYKYANIQRFLSVHTCISPRERSLEKH